MPIVVEVLSPEKYGQWVKSRQVKADEAAAEANKPWTRDELVARGEKVFTQNCVACHQANGMGVPGTFPALNGSPVVKGPKEKHIDIVLHGVVRDGKPTAMQPFAQLSDVDLAAVMTYERNAWNNKNGDVVMPADVKAGRSKTAGSASPAAAAPAAAAAQPAG
jgi:cytochrome c oxidase subunit 2